MKNFFKTLTLAEIIDQGIEDAARRLLETQHKSTHYQMLVKCEEANLNRLLQQKEELKANQMIRR